MKSHNQFKTIIDAPDAVQPRFKRPEDNKFDNNSIPIQAVTRKAPNALGHFIKPLEDNSNDAIRPSNYPNSKIQKHFKNLHKEPKHATIE